jgi:hypothetical protein
VRTAKSIICLGDHDVASIHTKELVGQRRAALSAEASHERLAGQLSPPARGDPDSARLVIAARKLVRQLRTMVAHAA